MWPDGWTAVTAGKRSIEFQHTLLVNPFMFSPESRILTIFYFSFHGFHAIFLDSKPICVGQERTKICGSIRISLIEENTSKYNNHFMCVG